MPLPVLAFLPPNMLGRAWTQEDADKFVGKPMRLGTGGPVTGKIVSAMLDDDGGVVFGVEVEDDSPLLASDSDISRWLGRPSA